MRNWKCLPILAFAVLLVSLMAAPGSARAVKGKLAPDFTGDTLDGKKLTLSEFRGKNPVVLNFFAEFCGPCKKEFPHLKALDEKFGPKGLKVVAVSMDEDRETAAIVPNANGVKFPVVFDPKSVVSDRYKVQVIPHTVVIDREGKVHAVVSGLNLEALDKAVAEVMN